MTTYAIGDIQGCHAEFVELLDLIGFERARDRIWLVGDLVNRGPGSLAVLRDVKALGDRAVTVLGNHDFHLLRLGAGYGKQHSGDTLGEILAAPDRDELVDWLAHRPLIHREGRWLMVHAGLIPGWDADRAEALAREVEAVLRSDRRQAFLEDLYGDVPDQWDDALQGHDRWRTIVNVCARLRFCDAEGKMEFDEKRGARFAPAGFKAWFDLDNRASADHRVICGHWSTQELMLAPNVLMLDSGCLWGGALTAVRLEDGRVYQVPSRLAVTPKPLTRRAADVDKG
ncbi:MAG: symmetrical bis(5'-nucleosyl)-tetraphosphatase [Betaproteobacteria bacterium]